MDPGDMQAAFNAPQHDVDPLFLEETLRFLDDACSSWRELADRWIEAADHARAADALQHLQRCEARRLAALAALRRWRSSGD